MEKLNRLKNTTRVTKPPAKLLNKPPSIFGRGAPRPGHVLALKGSGRVAVLSGRAPVWARAGTVAAAGISGRAPTGSASRHARFVIFYVARARILSIFCYSGTRWKKTSGRVKLYVMR